MTPEELVTLFRLDVDDTDADDPLWSEDEVYYYMDDAQKEFARRTDYFSDASTTEIVDIAYTAGDDLIPIDPRVIKIRSAKLVTNGTKIVPVTYADMEKATTNPSDYHSPYAYESILDWETSTGTPRYAVTDFETAYLRLAPIPVVDDTVRMRVYRLPLDDLFEGVSEFEISEEDYQRGLLHWMKYKAYSKNDVDTYDDRLMNKAYQDQELFIANTKRQLRRTRFASTTGVVRYGGL